MSWKPYPDCTARRSPRTKLQSRKPDHTDRTCALRRQSALLPNRPDLRLRGGTTRLSNFTFVRNLTKEFRKKRNHGKSTVVALPIRLWILTSCLSNYIVFRILVQGKQIWQNAQFLDVEIKQVVETCVSWTADLRILTRKNGEFDDRKKGTGKGKLSRKNRESFESEFYLL